MSAPLGFVRSSCRIVDPVIHRDSGKREGYTPPRSYHAIVTLCGARLSGDAAQLFHSLIVIGAQGGLYHLQGRRCARCALAFAKQGEAQ
jgi:hypothetical protein